MDDSQQDWSSRARSRRERNRSIRLETCGWTALFSDHTKRYVWEFLPSSVEGTFASSPPDMVVVPPLFAEDDDVVGSISLKVALEVVPCRHSYSSAHYSTIPSSLVLVILKRLTKLDMSQNRSFRWMAAVCFLVNGATLTVLCIGWRVEGITLTRHVYLLACAGVATLLCLLRVWMSCIHDARSISSGGWQLEAVCSAVEVAALSVLVALLYIPPAPKACLAGEGAAEFCRLIVREQPSPPCVYRDRLTTKQIIITITTGLALLFAVCRGVVHEDFPFRTCAENVRSLV